MDYSFLWLCSICRTDNFLEEQTDFKMADSILIQLNKLVELI